MQMSTLSSGTKQEPGKPANWKKDASAQDKANVVATKKFTQPDTANIVHKQKAADSSNASIHSSSSVRGDAEQVAREDGRRTQQSESAKDRRATSRPSSRPSSRASDRSKRESESAGRRANASLNQSTQSIQSGRPESKRSNKTDLSSNVDLSKRSAEGQDSTTNSIMSLNSASLGAGRSNSIASSDQIATSCELNSVNSAGQLNQSETSISSASNSKTAATLPRRTAASAVPAAAGVAESTATSTTSITSTTSQTASSSNTSGIVTSSPIRRRKKPPAPKPPSTATSTASLSTKSSSSSAAALSKQPRASKISSTTLNYNASSKVPSHPAAYSNAALSHSNSSLMTTCTDTCSSSLSTHLTNIAGSEVTASSADINSLKRRKKSSKNRPAPPVPVLAKSQEPAKVDRGKLADEPPADSSLVEQQNALNKARSSSCSKQLNKRINNGLRLTPHKTPCMSVSHRNKSNVKLRLNAILNRSLSEAFRLNAKAALNRQHSFSSEVSLNKRNLSTMINNTAFCSFGQNDQQNNGQHHTPDAKKKLKLEELELTKANLESLKAATKELRKSEALNKPDAKKDAKLDSKQINNWPAATVQKSDQCIESISPFASSVMDRSFINSNRLVNQLFTTQPKSVNQAPVRRSSSLPYLAFWTAKRSTAASQPTVDKQLGSVDRTNNRNGRKRTSALNVASDLIIETLSKNLSNGSADQLLYAASLLEEFSESVIAVPPLTSRLAGLLSPQHYQKHNLNNQLLLINHYIDCLKHEQEQEELLTVQLIEQQQVNRMMIEINKESLKDEPTGDRPEISKKEMAEVDKKEVADEDAKLDRRAEKTTSKPICSDKKSGGKQPVSAKTPSKRESLPKTANKTILAVNGHESTSDELHSDTSDGKVTVKCMPTNRLPQELTAVAGASSKPASSSGLSNSSSKTLLAEHPATTSEKRKRIDHSEPAICSFASKPVDRHAHHSHHCSNKHYSHSQSTHCLNEQQHSMICHQFTHTDESSSSSSQSTRSTEDLHWAKHHQFKPCSSIGPRLSSHLSGHLNSHLSAADHHSLLHQANHRQYLLNAAASSSECSTDESYSADSPMLLHLHGKSFLAHHQPSAGFSVLANPPANEEDDDLICACCCEHRTHSHRSGALPTGDHLTGKAGAYLFEPLAGKQHGAGGNYNNNQEAISNLYDYHSLHLTDMFNAGKLIIYCLLFLVIPSDSLRGLLWQAV